MMEAAPHFDVFVTLDQNLQFQNLTRKQRLGIVVLVTRFNHIAAYRPQFAEIRDTVWNTKPGLICF